MLRLERYLVCTFLLFTHLLPSPRSSYPVHNDCVTVDELLLEIADYKSNDQEVAAEQLKRLCSTSREAYSYL